jgi:hypothetical protein
LTFEEGEEISLERWLRFASKHSLTFDPHVVGQNTFKHGEQYVSVQFGQDGSKPDSGSDGRVDFSLCKPPPTAQRVLFTTTWMSSSVPDVAKLAIAAWQLFGGVLDADPEIRMLVRTVNIERGDSSE